MNLSQITKQLVDAIGNRIPAKEVARIANAIAPKLKIGGVKIQFYTTTTPDLLRVMTILSCTHARNGSSFETQIGQWLYGSGTFGSYISSYEILPDGSMSDMDNPYGEDSSFDDTKMQIVSIVTEKQYGADSDGESEGERKTTIDVIIYLPQ